MQNHFILHSDCTDERGIDGDDDDDDNNERRRRRKTTMRIIQFWHLPQNVVSWLV